MDKSRNEFEAWALDAGFAIIFPGGRFGMSSEHTMDVARKAWQASRKQALEEARTACEKIGDHEQDMGREKEAFGCDICCDAIRSLEGNTKETT